MVPVSLTAISLSTVLPDPQAASQQAPPSPAQLHIVLLINSTNRFCSQESQLSAAPERLPPGPVTGLLHHPASSPAPREGPSHQPPRQLTLNPDDLCLAGLQGGGALGLSLCIGLPRKPIVSLETEAKVSRAWHF